MRLLIVSATASEIAPITIELERITERGARVTACRRGPHEVDVLITGVGMVATAAWCARTLALTPYDLAFNFGVCGSFDRALPPGRVVHVVSDRIAELGAEDGDAFRSIQELNLVGSDEFPFAGGELVNQAPPVSADLSALPPVRGITVNTAHGSERSIADVVRRFAPQVETMEGAAFMYACRIHGQVFAQVRSVSNMVERRNRDAWRLADAVASLGNVGLAILDAL